MFPRLIITTALIATLTVLSAATFSQQPKAAGVGRWHYKIADSNSVTSTGTTVEEGLNGLGEQGWELVNAEHVTRAGNINVTVFYLKRQIN